MSVGCSSGSEGTVCIFQQLRVWMATLGRHCVHFGCCCGTSLLYSDRGVKSKSQALSGEGSMHLQLLQCIEQLMYEWQYFPRCRGSAVEA